MMEDHDKTSCVGIGHKKLMHVEKDDDFFDDKRISFFTQDKHDKGDDDLPS